MTTYKAPPRWCAMPECHNTGTILCPQLTKPDSHEAAYICLSCARKEYPTLFPKPEKQPKLFEDKGYRVRSTKGGVGDRHLVPLEGSGT